MNQVRRDGFVLKLLPALLACQKRAGGTVKKMADNKERWTLPGAPGFLEATRAFGDWWGARAG